MLRWRFLGGDSMRDESWRVLRTVSGLAERKNARRSTCEMCLMPKSGLDFVDLLKHPAAELRGFFRVSGSVLFSLSPLDPAPGERGLRGHSTFPGHVFGT